MEANQARQGWGEWARQQAGDDAAMIQPLLTAALEAMSYGAHEYDARAVAAAAGQNAGAESVIGTVLHFHERHEHLSEGWQTVWNFTVVPLPHINHLSEPLPIEMRSAGFEGKVSDQDFVQLPADEVNQRRSGETLAISGLYNISFGSRVRSYA